jgi:hypothetical protein
MSDFNHPLGERGIALVMALLITAIIGLMAAALSYTISSYLKNLAMVREKNQGYYAAAAGSEEVRDFLGFNNCAPPSWCGLLGVVTSPTNSSYQPQTATMQLNPASPWQTTASQNGIGSKTGYIWNFYLKDNDDGDGDFTNDNDGIILASVVTHDPNNNTTTTVEAMFIFTANNSIYSQLGGGPAKTNNTSQIGSGQSSGNTVQTTM